MQSFIQHLLWADRMKQAWFSMRCLRLVMQVSVLIGSVMAQHIWAAPPDLTAGEEPHNDVTINLGPTGMRGYVYHRVEGGRGGTSAESRQILVTSVASGSPASGRLAANDVILGADGSGAEPIPFSSDARRAFALAIADAEARDPAELKLLRWRNGTTTTQTITLQHLGAYAETAPYDCAKSAQILSVGLDRSFQHELQGTPGDRRSRFNFITLLLSDNSDHQARLRDVARGLVPNATTRAQMMADVPDETGMITWERGYVLVFLAEYYLATGDTYVLPGIEAYAVNIAKNQSHYGTVGHRFADWNLDGTPNGPLGGVYGAVNQTGLTLFQGLVLAKECGLQNPELAPAITRMSTFFSYYSGKSCIPYGEHAPGGTLHENNGTSGQTALALSRVPGREEEARFFAKMATAGAENREQGHTGPWWNYFWAPLGANVGGEEAAAAYFSQISWHLDLARTWQGDFVYDNLNGEGPDSGSLYHGFRMSTAALMTYGLPLRKLYIGGRNQNPDSLLDLDAVAEAIEAIAYDASARTMEELFADLESWSPKVTQLAAEEISARGVNGAQLDALHAIAMDTDLDASARAGVCEALRVIRSNSSAAVLAGLLTDADAFVRFRAAEALRYLHDNARQSVLDTILDATITTAKPAFPLDDEDPLQFAHGNLAMLLFYHHSAYGPQGILWRRWDALENQGLIDRDKLYPAIRAVAATPVGLARSTLNWHLERRLTYEDILAVSGAILDAVRFRSPADRMFSGGVREGGVRALHKHNIAEGVPACMAYLADEVGGRRRGPIALLGDYFGGSVHTVVPDPGTVPFLESYLDDWEVGDDAQTALDRIAADTDPVILDPLKQIESVSVDDPVMTRHTTILRVNGHDHARGDSSFAWTKLEGPGHVAFGEETVVFCEEGVHSESATVLYATVPGEYLLEVTMSDSRGFTEVSDTVAVTVAVQGAAGGELSYADGHFIHTFREGGDTALIVPDGMELEVDVLVVGGGGGGGSSTDFSNGGAAGGGAGGLVYETQRVVSGETVVDVGVGGAGAPQGNQTGMDGGDSRFGSITALGGGGGGGGHREGRDGGSGGGSRGSPAGLGLQSDSDAGGYGHDGAEWRANAGDAAGGGGGAGSAAPSIDDFAVGGSGGDGRLFSISGDAVFYAAGGGGGAAQSGIMGVGGSGIGGNGANDETAPTAGRAHTGSGGGGGNNNWRGAAGGSGVVIVRYAAPPDYALTIFNGSGSGIHSAGAMVAITADPAPEGQVFLGWTGDTEGIAHVYSPQTTLTMPAGPAVVTAMYGYEEIPFIETFEALELGSLHDQRSWIAQDVVVQNEISLGTGNQAAKVDQDQGFLQRVFRDERTEVWTELHVLVEPMAAGNTPIPMEDATVFFYVGPDYEVMLYDAKALVSTGVTVAEDAWVRFTVYSDYDASTWDLYVDGVRIGTFSFYDTQLTSYTILEVKGGAGTYVDDIAITLDPPDWRALLHTLTVNHGIGSGLYAEGAIVDIVADTAPDGKTFDIWTGDVAGVADIHSASTTLTMPATAVTVTATYRDVIPPIDDLREHALDHQDPQASMEAGMLVYRHLLRTDDPWLVYQVQTRESLLWGDWLDLDVLPHGTNVIGTVFDEVIYHIPMDEDMHFFRLRITRPSGP